MHSFSILKRAGHLKLYRVYAYLSLLLLTGIQKNTIPMNMILKTEDLFYPDLPHSVKCIETPIHKLTTHSQPAGSTSFQMSS